MSTITRKKLITYINNSKKLQETFLNLGLDEVVAATDENIRIAEKYLEFLEKNRLVLGWGSLLYSLKRFNGKTVFFKKS